MVRPHVICILFLVILSSSFLIPDSSASEVHLTLLHTTDLHAHILPSTDYEGKTDVGGAARCAWMIEKIRKEEKNVLLVDAGDLDQGSALGYLTEGRVMIQTINYLKYTSWTLGNHEFDWGIEKLAPLLLASEVPILAANLHHKPSSATAPSTRKAFEKVQPFIIKEVEGVRIGIVGLATPGIPNWTRPRLIPGITLESSVKALKRVIPKMKAAGCKILILVTHQGIREQGDDHANQILGIAQSFPELDVIVGGHSHRLHEEQMIHGVLYTQAKYWGTYLGRVDLVYDSDNKKLLSRHAHAIPMDVAVPKDEELLALVRPDLERTKKYLATRVGETSEPLHSLTGPRKETPVFNLLCAAIAEGITSRGGKVDAVVHGLLNDRTYIKAGPIWMSDVFDIVPYENTIGVATLTRDQLVEILEENATSYRTGRFRGIWGLQMKLSPSAPYGQRVLFLGDAEGKPLTSETRLRVAFNSYELASGGTRWKRLREIADGPTAELKEYDFQTRDAVEQYIRRNSPLKMELHGWWSTERKKAGKKEVSDDEKVLEPALN